MACDKINRSGTWLPLHNQRSADTGQTAARRASRSWVTAKKRREHTASAVKANNSHHVTPTGTRSASATTGGVTTRFASLGDIMLAEPGALIGFAGPRVIEQTIGEKLPAGFQRSEFQYEHGFVDKVVPRTEMRETLAQLLRLHA